MTRDAFSTPTLDDIRLALRLGDFDSDSAQGRMAPRLHRQQPQNRDSIPRQAAVLFLLFPAQGQLTFLLTKRSEHLSKHRGQISLPGGSSDFLDRDTGETALREAREEVGITPEDVELIGELSSLYIPHSNFQVFPHVGFIAYHPVFIPSEDEVAALIEVPLVALLDDANKHDEPYTFTWGTADVPHYRFGEHIIWGATAMILSELEGRLRTI